MDKPNEPEVLARRAVPLDRGAQTAVIPSGEKAHQDQFFSLPSSIRYVEAVRTPMLCNTNGISSARPQAPC